MKYYIRVRTEEQLKAVLGWHGSVAPVLILDWALLQDVQLNDLPGDISKYIALPDTAKQKNTGFVRKIMETAGDGTGIMIKNPDQLEMAAEMELNGQEVIADSSLYAYNYESFLFYEEVLPGMMFAAGDELSDQELIKMAGAGEKRGKEDLYDRIIYKVYGHQALMITEQCISRNHCGCKGDTVKFKNDKGDEFYSVSKCGQCYSIIYDARAVWLFDRIGKIPFEKYMIDLTVEDLIQTEKIMETAFSEKRNTQKSGDFKYIKGCRVNSVE